MTTHGSADGSNESPTPSLHGPERGLSDIDTRSVGPSQPVWRVPTVVAIPTKTGHQWTFRCPHCRDWHFHGVGAGHRVAHCWRPNSPFDATGYYLVGADAVEAA